MDSRSSSLETVETRDLYDKRSGLSAWDTFFQRALDLDFLAKELSIQLNLLRRQRELKSGQVSVLCEASWPWKLQVPTCDWLVAAGDAFVIRWSWKDTVHEMARKFPFSPGEGRAITCGRT